MKAAPERDPAESPAHACRCSRVHYAAWHWAGHVVVPTVATAAASRHGAALRVLLVGQHWLIAAQAHRSSGGGVVASATGRRASALRDWPAALAPRAAVALLQTRAHRKEGRHVIGQCFDAAVQLGYGSVVGRR